METWLTYSPQDFLAFSDRVYWRLFELHNAALWPAQVPAILAGLAVVVLLIRRPNWAGRAIAVILALAWAVSALTFLPRYASINWAADGFIPVFLGQAVLLGVLGSVANTLQPRAEGSGSWIGLGLALYGLAVYPAVLFLSDRVLAGIQVFALMPDPTAIVTLGAVLASAHRWPSAMLTVVPLLWCLASWATLATLGALEAWAFAPVAIAVLASLWVTRAAPRFRASRGSKATLP